jgi:VanZ family protein
VTASPRWRAAAVFWAGAIVVSGVAPIGSVVEAVGPPDPVTTTGHFIAYAVLAFVLVVALDGWRATPQTLVLSFVLALGLGAVVEVVQGPIPYRDASLFDLAVDVAGAAVGLAVVSVVARGRRSRSHPG